MVETSYHIITLLFYASIMLVAVDRLLCIMSPTRYYVRVRAPTLKRTIRIIWFVSILIPALVAFLPISTSIHDTIVTYISQFSQVAFLISSVAAYALITWSHFKRVKLLLYFSISYQGSVEWKRVKRTFRTSFSLVSSFILFYVVPTYVSTNIELYHILLLGIK